MIFLSFFCCLAFNDSTLIFTIFFAGIFVLLSLKLNLTENSTNKLASIYRIQPYNGLNVMTINYIGECILHFGTYTQQIYYSLFFSSFKRQISSSNFYIHHRSFRVLRTFYFFLSNFNRFLCSQSPENSHSIDIFSDYEH